MANFQQSNTYGQYFGYGSSMQYDSSQNKWSQGSATNTGNQSLSQNQQNQQQMYQPSGQAAQYYANASGSGFYNSQYGQQNFNSGMNSMSSSGVGSSTNTVGSTSTSAVGKKSSNKFGSATGTGSANSSMGFSSNYGAKPSSDGFGASGNFGNNANSNSASVNALSQMFGSAYGNSGQTPGMNNSTMTSTSNQSFGGSMTPDAMGQFNQVNQLLGNGTNFGNSSSGNDTGGGFGTGYNAMNSGMMTLLQQTLLQQANGGASFGAGTNWGMSDGDGGYYAPPMDGSFQFGSGAADNKQGKKGKKWSGKDNRQDFYGNRFAQMFTGMPAIMGQSQTGSGKQKRLMDGVRFNAKGEKVMDVEVPLSLYSRWGQLRKFFSKQDTEVAKHLIEFHDEMCEECFEREQGKTKGSGRRHRQESSQGEPEVETEISEEDKTIQDLMGFRNFNTTRGAMVKGNQVDNTPESSVPDKSTASSSWEAKAGFIGPVIPAKEASEEVPSGTKQGSETGKIADASAGLSEEEKLVMEKLGWSVFNRKVCGGHAVKTMSSACTTRNTFVWTSTTLVLSFHMKEHQAFHMILIMISVLNVKLIFRIVSERVHHIVASSSLWVCLFVVFICFLV